MCANSKTETTSKKSSEHTKDIKTYSVGISKAHKAKKVGRPRELTEENLELIQGNSRVGETKTSLPAQQNLKRRTPSPEDDKSSILSKVTSREGEIEVSELYVSSDAETEQMNVEQEDLDALRLGELAGGMKLEKEERRLKKRMLEEDEDDEGDKRLKKEVVQDGEAHLSDEEQKLQKPKVPSSPSHSQSGTGSAVGHGAGGDTMKLQHQENQEDIESEDNEDEEEEEEEEEEEVEEESNAAVSIGHEKRGSRGSNNKDEFELSNEEKEKFRQDALKDIIDIEYDFAKLRQRLYENELAKLQTELQMCLEGSHPSLQNYYQMIDSIRDFKLKKAYQRQKYELNCIDQETRAVRTFIHQNFYRQVSDMKHKLLNETTQKWYDINKERREMDVLVSEVNYHIPVKIANKTLSCITGYAGPSQLRRPGDPLPEHLECEGINFRFKNNPVDKLEVVVDRMRLNNELSDLEGLKRFFGGFPGAPSLSGLKESEVYEDFQNLTSQ